MERILTESEVMTIINALAAAREAYEQDAAGCSAVDLPRMADQFRMQVYAVDDLIERIENASQIVLASNE